MATTTITNEAILLGEGIVRVDAYVDFLCPYCRIFEEEAGPLLDSLLDDGQITLAYHPLGFLDRLSTTNYSTRASAASRCAADGDRFREYTDALFASQPDEGGPGLSDEQLVELGHAVGLGEDFAACVTSGRYAEWTEGVTAAAMEQGVGGTPTVLVDGAPVDRDPQSIAAAVAAAAS